MAGLLDTHPTARRVQIELLRSASPWRKVQLWDGLNQGARWLALAGLRSRYPQAGQAELRRRLAELLLGADLATRAYGPLEEERDDPRVD